MNQGMEWLQENYKVRKKNGRKGKTKGKKKKNYKGKNGRKGKTKGKKKKNYKGKPWLI